MTKTELLFSLTASVETINSICGESLPRVRKELDIILDRAKRLAWFKRNKEYNLDEKDNNN